MGRGLCAGAHRLKTSLPPQLDVSVLLGPSLTPRQWPRSLPKELLINLYSPCLSSEGSHLLE